MRGERVEGVAHPTKGDKFERGTAHPVYNVDFSGGIADDI